MIIALKKLMKNIFYYFFSIFFFSSIVYANELDEELIDKKFNQIKTTEFCTTNEWSEIEKKDFIAAFILGWYWEIKEADESDKIDKQSLNKLFNEVCGKKSLLIENLENLIIKNNIKRFYYTGHDWIKLDLERKKIFIKGYNAGIKSNNHEKKKNGSKI